MKVDIGLSGIYDVRSSTNRTGDCLATAFRVCSIVGRIIYTVGIGKRKRYISDANRNDQNKCGEIRMIKTKPLSENINPHDLQVCLVVFNPLTPVDDVSPVWCVDSLESNGGSLTDRESRIVFGSEDVGGE
jgi:hypothetical protein